MASCLVPDFPAVMVAQEHLKELDKELKEDAVLFAPDVCLHLREITAAITELEADRRAAHEHLEVETIEYSKLRHQINNFRERMSQEIMADVAAARASNAKELEQLQKELNTITQLQEATVERQEAALIKNKALYPERDQVKAEHKEIIAALNEQITLKYNSQTCLAQTRELIEELKTSIAAAEQDTITMEKKIAQEREEFSVKKDNLAGEVSQIQVKIEQQKQVNKKSKKELETVNNKKKEIHDDLENLMIDMAERESNMQRLRASQSQFEKQLEEETQKHQELRQQRETMKKQMCDLEEAFSVANQRLKEEIATVEGKIEEGRAARLPLIKLSARMCEIFKRQHNEENEVKVEHFHISQQLLRSKLQLEERIASIVRHSKEIKEMDKEIRELVETLVINKRVFESNREDLCGNIETQKKKISHFEEERSRLTRLLEEAKMKQEEHVAKMTSDISNNRRRREELQQEEAALQQRQPMSADAELLRRHVTQSQVKYRQMEDELHQEIERCTAEVEVITQSNEEKQREVEEKEETLKDVESKMMEEQTRHERLTMLNSELSRSRSELELSIQGLKEETGVLLRSREERRAELEALRASHMDVLNKQASELRDVEISIYNNSVKLEQVIVENSRLHLCIRQMTEDVSRVGQNRSRYWQEVHKFNVDTKALCETLQKAWGEDLQVTQDCQSSDGVLLMSMSGLLNHLKTRRRQLGNVNSLLHQEMLEFSRRLGDKSSVAQHS